MRGLKIAQFGLFLILLGFTVSLFSNVLFVLGEGAGFLSGEDGDASMDFALKVYAWGLLSLPIAWILSAVGKCFCVAAPEEKSRVLIASSIACDLSIGGFIYLATQSLAMLLPGLIGVLIAALASYILFLKFLSRMGDNVGQPRVSQYAGILYALIGVSFIVGGVGLFSSSIGVFGVNLFGFFTTCLFNYTIFVLYRAMPLYIEEVKAGITDPTESAEMRAEQERKARLKGPGGGGGGPSQSRPVEEPQGPPPEGHKLYRIPKGLNELHMACKEGDKFKVERQISLGESPTETVKHGLTPLHIAASVGVMEVADTLIKAGAPVDQTCEMGLTPLYFAVQTGNHNIVGFFVDKGANLFHKNEQGYTPLHWACCAPHPNCKGPVRVKMVHLLISQGSDINATTNDGKTARDLALENQLEDVIAALDGHLNTGASAAKKRGPEPVKVEDAEPSVPPAYEPF